VPQRFGQATDYSQNFAYLARENQTRLEQSAQQLDRRLEEEQAAEDELMFAKYAEGKVSGQQIIAYIQKRVRETGHDKAQQAKWKAALVEYQNNVADQRATAAYEESGNINAFISHWKQRLGSTKKGTPERTQIVRLLSQLREERDGKALQRGASAIMRKIQRGKATNKDLIQYYRDAIASGKHDAETVSQIRDTITNLQAKQRREQYQVTITGIEQELASGQISPQEAARRMREAADKYGLEELDPVAYAQQEGEWRVLNAMPDPVEVQKWQNRFAAGDITAEEYAAQMGVWAEQIEPFDAKSAWELRGNADRMVREYQEAQRLPGGEILGHGEEDQPGSDSYGGAAIVGNVVANRKKIAHVTQLDGGAYSNINCTMASAAMMGHTLGTSGLTGSDLRGITQDTVGGTTLLQAKYALEQSGVDPEALRYKDNLSFDKFKINIKQGATSMVSGYLGNMGGSGLNNAGASYNHNVYVVKYHPKKGFLVLDPAKRNDKGTWLSESQMRAFAWTGDVGVYSRNGSVMMSPKGTLMTRWNKGKTYDPRNNKSYSSRVTASQAQRERSKAGAAFGGELYGEEGMVEFISVSTPAVNPANEQYEGQFSTGTTLIDVADAAQAERESFASEEHIKRLENAGIEYGSADLDTRDEVIAETQRRSEDISSLSQVISAFEAAYEGGDGPVRVVVGSEVMYLTLEEISQLERELVVALDGQSMLQYALGDHEGANQTRENIANVIIQSATLTDTDTNWEMNRLLSSELENLRNAEGPAASRAAMERMIDNLTDFTDEFGMDESSYDPTTGTVTPPEGDVSVETQQDVYVNAVGDATIADAPAQVEVEQLNQLLAILDDPKATPEQVMEVVTSFAEQSDAIQMPEGWPESPQEGTGNALGQALLELSAQRNDFWNVDNGMGTMVLAGGQEHYVDFEYSAGASSAGGRDEGANVMEGVPTEEGPMDMVVGTGANQQLNRDQVQALIEANGGGTLPPEFRVTGNGLPVSFMMVDGELQPVHFLPDYEAYGPQQVQVKNAEQLNAYLESQGIVMSVTEGDFLSWDQIAQLGGVNAIQRLVSSPNEGGETLALVDYMVYSVQMPGQQSKWFMDPATQMWSYDGLPGVNANASALPGADDTVVGVNLVGSEKNEQGQWVVEYGAVESDDKATTGVPTPFGNDVPMEEAQIAQLSGEGNPDSGQRRDAEGNPVQASELQVQDSYTDFGLAVTVLEDFFKAGVDALVGGAEAVVEGMQPPDSGMLGDPSMGLPNVGLGMLSAEDPLASVGATDSRSFGWPSFDVPEVAQDTLENLTSGDWWKSQFETVGNAVAQANIPKVDWKPATGVEGNFIQSEMGYVEVDQPSSAEDWTPPKPETPTPPNKPRGPEMR
jgi:hypothetical protein